MPIKKVKGGYAIENVPGKQPTLAKAKRQLRAIKAAQARRRAR